MKGTERTPIKTTFHFSNPIARSAFAVSLQARVSCSSIGNVAFEQALSPDVHNLIFVLPPVSFPAQSNPPRIDRHGLVSRHNVTLTAFDTERPMQVGNGEFAFGMDVTGLQTFVPFNTMSHWGWNSDPLPAGQRVEDFKGQVWDTHGRPVRYPMPDPDRPELTEWLAANPHRINLGRIGLILTKKDGLDAAPEDLRNIRQSLDLWTGVVTSRFEVEGEQVTVVTAAHPKLDAVAVQIRSPLIAEKRLAAFVSCPGNDSRGFANYVGDWSHPGQFDLVSRPDQNSAVFLRTMNDTRYWVGLRWDAGSALQLPKSSHLPLEILSAEYGANDRWLDVTEVARRAVNDGSLNLVANNDLGPDPILGVRKSLRVTYRAKGITKSAEADENQELAITADPDRQRLVLKPTGDVLSFTCTFSSKVLSHELTTPDRAIEASRASWPRYWNSGGVLDLSGSTDPRWKEIERRVVLSQYLMAVNEAGSFPPQESGLVNNGWFGRFHMEMFWWHAAHWALWNRWSEVESSLDIYKKLLPSARKLAASEGYKGARWPKCIGNNLREWPHEIHALLIWQQPHPIFFAELDYRAHPTRKTLLKWAPVVNATADFLASYAFFDEASQRFVLGPPLQVVSENAEVRRATNPTFELGYWRFGLRTAQLWRQRLGQTRRADWDKVLAGLAPLSEEQGLYILYEGLKNMWTKFNFEHPALTGSFGMLPGDGVDREAMHRTLDKVVATWDFNRTWGWDFPMLAMCAARLGEPERAIDFLTTAAPGFQFDQLGLASGGPFPYFPSNGGLLYAVAMMAAGWDDAPHRPAPGFPADGRWKVRFEGLSPAP